MRYLTSLALAGLLVLACSDRQAESTPSLLYGRMLDAPRSLATFELVDQHGDPFVRERLGDRWSILFAGFTHCPDICPTTLATLTAAQKRAGISSDQLQIVFLSVDPQRDSPEHLAAYMRHFNPEWTALTGAKAEIDRLLGSLEMAYVRVPMGNGEYTMDHSTALVLIDPDGRMRGYFTAPLDAAELADDLGRIARAGR